MKIKYFSAMILASVVFLIGAEPSKIRVAAVQMQAEMGDVDANLAKAERLVRQAFKRGAVWVILPEFFTSAVAIHPRMLDAARALNGKSMQLLKSLAKEYRGVVGGSFIAIREGHSYNTFVLAFPDGSTYLHDKDFPTFWENNYYIGGSDDGVLNTAKGPVGVALCWEFVRSGTVKRLLGRVGMVVGGSCWWTSADDDKSDTADGFRRQSLSLLKETPVKFARMLGVPVVHASHAGIFRGYAQVDEKDPYNSHYLGETMIVDGRGQILARMSYEDGEGVILADITPGEVEGTHEAIPARFWIPDFSEGTMTRWQEAIKIGRKYYDEVTMPHRLKQFPKKK
jgi:predicted amidohydrolase